MIHHIQSLKIPKIKLRKPKNEVKIKYRNAKNNVSTSQKSQNLTSKTEKRNLKEIH